MESIRKYPAFILRCVRLSLAGGPLFYTWMTVLTCIILLGVNAWARQLASGLHLTSMNDQVSWGFYIGNFTFFVGVAAGGVILTIPFHLYKKLELRQALVFCDMQAIASIVTCLLFITVDLGRPDRFWHLIPGIGKFNFPISMLSWDVITLNGFLLINLHVWGYHLYMKYLKREVSPLVHKPFVAVAMLWALSALTVEAFLFAGLGARHGWNSAVVGPRMIASAFATGPAFMIIALLVIRSTTRYGIDDKVIHWLRRVLQVTSLICLYLLVNEVFVELYAGTGHGASMKHLLFGLHDHVSLVVPFWMAMIMMTIASILLLLPWSKNHSGVLIFACGLLFVGLWLDKNVGFILSAFIPTPLGEVVDLAPTWSEWMVCCGIWAFGLMIYTLLAKVSIPILMDSTSHYDEDGVLSKSSAEKEVQGA